MKTIQLTCFNCNCLFDRALNQYTRQTKKGITRFFCSLSCNRLKLNEENPPTGNLNNLKINKLDELSPFRWFIKTTKQRTKSKNRPNIKFKEFNLDLEYIKNLWEQQNGICPLTGVKLILPKGTDNTDAWIEKNPYNASLDRINNDYGYIQGNVRFISEMANYARNTFSDDQLIEFCQQVSSFRN